jgi:Phytanoyl-CoA dioxygenase (PhyH)
LSTKSPVKLHQATRLPADVVREVTADEVERFREDGWVKLEGLIDPAYAARMLSGAVELMGESGDQAELRPGLDVDFDRWYDKHFLASDGIEPFRSLTYSDAMGRNAQLLMQRNVAVRHWADMIGCRPPVGRGERDAATPYHQDYPCGQFDRVGNTSFWIALNDIPAERGTMRFRSGSHREGPLGRSFTASTTADVHDVYPRLKERYPLSEPFDFRAGDATCHSQLVLHGAPQNTTDEPRWTYITIYFPADTLYTGASFHGRDRVELQIDKPFEDPHFPIVYSPGK